MRNFSRDFFIFALCASCLTAQSEKAATTPKKVHRVLAAPFEADVKRERDHYDLVAFNFPAEVVIEGSGLDVLPGNRIAVSTRRGEVWLLDGALETDVSKIRAKLFATGLHEPLSLFWRDGWFYVTERDSFIRLRDIDGDDRSDESEIVASGFGSTGNFHEYAFSSRPDKNGDVWLALCLTDASKSPVPWRGWALRVTADGRLLPTSAGVRSPGGIGFNDEGDCFYTDNQGDWNGTSALKHLMPGSFQGAPPSLKWWERSGLGQKPQEPKTGRILTDRMADPTFIPPAVLMPHNRVGRSPTGFAYDSTGKFGPFGRQLFVAEHTFSQINRVFLEKINGVYQGAVFPFLSGLQSGPIGMRFASDGSLFVTSSARGWGAKGGKAFAFERVRWRGVTPFEPLEIRAQPDGFLVTFTEPVDAAAASNLASYAVSAWTYLHSSDYGSEELERFDAVVSKAEVAADGRSVRLIVAPMTRGHLYEIKLDGVRDTSGEKLVHPIGWYTLNEIPRN